MNKCSEETSTNSNKAFEDLRERVVGYKVPGGVFLVEGYERSISHDAMLAPPLPADTLHPVWILLGSLRGMGISMHDLIALAEPTAADRVLFGEMELSQIVPLRSNVSYVVTGRIRDLERRNGRRAGTIDRLVLVLEIADASGRLCAASSQTLLILRGESNGP